jgi:hypothetical protein
MKQRFLSMVCCIPLFATITCAAEQDLPKIDLLDPPLVTTMDGDEWCQPSNLTEFISFPSTIEIRGSDFPVNCEVTVRITSEGKGTIQSVKCSDERFKPNIIDAFNKVIWKSSRSGSLCKISDNEIIYPVMFDIE